MSDSPVAHARHIVRPLDPLAAAAVVVLCLSWGFNQVATKLAISDIPPLIQATVRSTVAALIIALWCKTRGIKLCVRDGTLVPGIVAGLLFGGEFILIYQGLLYTAASRATLVLPGDRFSPAQWLGLVLSFMGMALAFSGSIRGDNPHQTLGDAMMVAAALFWAATTLTIKASALSRIAAEKVMLYQLVVSSPMMAGAAFVAGERVTHWPSALAIGALSYQTIWVVSVTFVIWFALIARYSASRLSAFTFLTPLFGVAAGHLVLGEPLTGPFLAAVALTAFGLVLVNRAPRC